MRKILTGAVTLALCASSFAATHIFWYKATTNAYNLQASAPGPGIPAGATVHEGMIASGCIAQHTGSQQGNAIVFGSGLDDAQGRCGFIWSKDLSDATGTATAAKVRAEFRDAWSGSAFCNAGSIAIRCGVVDFQGNLDTWGGADMVPETADWQDFLNPLGSAMGYDLTNPTLGAEETINYTAPAARPDEFSGSVLDGQFFEIDVTDQVNYILSNAGQHGIVFLVSIGAGSTGKVNSYGNEATGTPDGSLGSDAPWNQDGNTAHVWVESTDLVSVEKGGVKTFAQHGVALTQNLPNPFTSATTFAYNTADAGRGLVKVFDANGKVVFSKAVKGQGSITWNAAEKLSAGVYFYRLTAGNKVVSKRMILVR